MKSLEQLAGTLMNEGKGAPEGANIQYMTPRKTSTKAGITMNFLLFSISSGVSTFFSSDNNPQGFMAERFEILENRDIRTVER